MDNKLYNYLVDNFMRLSSHLSSEIFYLPSNTHDIWTPNPSPQTPTPLNFSHTPPPSPSLTCFGVTLARFSCLARISASRSEPARPAGRRSAAGSEDAGEDGSSEEGGTTTGDSRWFRKLSALPEDIDRRGLHSGTDVTRHGGSSNRL